MIKDYELYNKATLEFPRRSDIRKGRMTDGSKLLRSFFAEVNHFNEAIEALRASFFAINYNGNADDILLDIEKFSVGNPDELIVDGYELCTEQEFVTKQNGYFVEDGICYVHKTEHGRIAYIANGIAYEAQTEPFRMWNIIDEFALMASIERYEDETNSELLARVFESYKYPPNSSVEGLKNAIKNSISNEMFLHPDDIKIESINEQLLYETFNSKALIDELGELNQDAIRYKVWGKSKWSHDFAPIEYVAPEWDHKLPAIQDGVGNMKALYAKDISAIDNLEARIDTYDLSEKEVLSYIASNNIDIDVKLLLTKLNNELVPQDIPYQVKAELATDVSDMNIKLFYDQRINKKVPLYQVINNILQFKDMFKTKHEVKKGIAYKLRVTPTEAYSGMKIRDISIYTKDNVSNVRQASQGFYENRDGVLLPNNVKEHIESVTEMYDVSGLEDSDEGIKLSSTGTIGEAVIPIEAYDNQYINYRALCESVDFTLNSALVKKNNFKTSGSKLVSDGQGASVTAHLKGSYLSFEIESGAAEVIVTVDDEEVTNKIVSVDNYELMLEGEHRIGLSIKAIGAQETVIAKMQYKNFSIDFSAEKAELIKGKSGLLIHNAQQGAKLKVTVSSRTGFSPAVQYIHIGGITTGLSYETLFTPKEDGYLFVDVDGKCSLTAANQTIDYDQRLTIENNSSGVIYLPLDDERYQNILVDAYKTRRLFTGEKEMEYVVLPQGDYITDIAISGEKSKTVLSKSIKELMGADTVFASSYTSGFVVGNNIKTLSLRNIGVLFNRVEVENTRNISPIFYIDGVSKEGNSFKGYATDLGCRAISATSHIAYGSERLLSAIKRDIPIPMSFSPSLDKNKKYVYQLPESGRATIVFDNGLPICVEPKSISIKVENITASADNYTTETITLTRKSMLSSEMPIDRTFKKDQVLLDLAEYNVSPPEGLTVRYASENTEQKETFYAEDDGFNKLKYANIGIVKSLRINGKEMLASDYSVLKDEGLIYWHNESAYGQPIDVTYTYKVPESLVVKDLSYLYKETGYSVETMKHKETFFLPVSQGENVLEDAIYTAIKNSKSYTIGINNERYNAALTQKTLTVSIAYDEDEIVVKSGFYYRGGNEYYRFAQPHEATVSGANGIQVIDGYKYGGDLHLSQASENYVPNSSMQLNKEELISYIDFKNEYNVPDVVSLHAADTINYWKTEGMSMSFIDNGWSRSTAFKKEKDFGRALLWLNPIMQDRGVVAIKANAPLELKRGFLSANKEPLIKSYSMSGDIELLHTPKSDYYYQDLTSFMKEGVPVYLCVSSDTVIEDIVATNNYDKNVHRRNGDIINAGFLPKRTQSEVITIPYRSQDVRYSDVEIKEGTIRTGSNIYWGYTPLKQFGKDWKEVSISGMDIEKEQWIINETNSGTLITTAIPIPHFRHIESFAVCLNEASGAGEVILSIETCQEKYGNYQTVFSAKKGASDVFEINGKVLKQYIKVRIDVTGRALISELDIYAKYHSKDGRLFVSPVESGNAQTKYYDIGEPCNVYANALSDGKDYEIYVRGVRQNDKDLVHTKWYNVSERHLFEAYRYLQFDIRLLSKDAYVNISQFRMEVM